MAYEDWHAVKAGLKATNELWTSSGDWGRKDCLKMYKATHLVAMQDLA